MTEAAILFGPFVLAGIERATVTPSISPGFSLDYIDWSHSLVMSLVWSVLFAAAFARYGRRVMMAIGFAVFSHFLLDLPMHPPVQLFWIAALWQTSLATDSAHSSPPAPLPPTSLVTGGEASRRPTLSSNGAIPSVHAKVE